MVKYYRKKSAYPKTQRSSTTAFNGDTNTAVKKTIAKAQKKLYKRKQSTAGKAMVNRMALMTLSRQINNLQRSKLGEFQQCREKIGFQPSWSVPAEEPLCFCLNDFNNSYTLNVGAPVYRGVVTGAVYSKVGNWSVLTNFPVATDSVDYFFKSENNTASKIIYAPISTTFNIQARKTMTTGEDPIVLRIDIVKQKKCLTNLIRKLELPHSIVGLGKMAMENVAVRNTYNKEFITILDTKYLYLSNKDSSDKEIRKQANFYVKFNPKKPLRTDSEADGSSNTENDFYVNIDPKEQIWAVVNFSNNDLAGLDINMFRTNRWYDQHGTD